MNRYQPALLGGLFIGVLSALPVVNVANCCCLWVVVGGGLTTYLLQQARPAPVETSEAALFGLIAGLVGGVLYMTATAVILSGAMGAQLMDQLRETMNNNPEMPAEVRDRISSADGRRRHRAHRRGGDHPAVRGLQPDWRPARSGDLQEEGAADDRPSPTVTP